jgi:hypothetical protein
MTIVVVGVVNHNSIYDPVASLVAIVVVADGGLSMVARAADVQRFDERRPTERYFDLFPQR